MSFSRLMAAVFLVLCVTPDTFGEGFNERFEGGIDAQWGIACSAGNEIVFDGGQAEIHANLNTYAYMSRSSVWHGTEQLTVSARIKPSIPAGVSWCTSIFMVWDGGNWCQMGMISAPDGGRFYSVEMRNGVGTETYLDQCDLSEWHYLRIQVGDDCIRYFASADGETWAALRVIERPEDFDGSVVRLAVGKGFGRNIEPYAHPDLQNDYADKGERVVSRIADIRVENTPANLLKLTNEERKTIQQSDLDPVGLIELQGKADPTFESVAGHYPPMKYPKETVGVPEHPIDISVDHLGRLQLNYDQPLISWLEIGGRPFREEGTPITRQLLDGYIPILTLTTNQDGVEYEQTIFGWNEGFSPNKELTALIRLKARASERTRLPDSVSLVSPAGKLSDWPMVKTGSDEAEVCLRFTFPNPETAASMPIGEFEERLSETSAFWRELIRRGARFEIPDVRVNEAYKAWLAYGYLLVDKTDGVYRPHDGCGFYETVYGYSAALYCIALDWYGMHRKAELYLDTLLHYQQPNGLYSQDDGLLSHGPFLFALAEHYKLTGNERWLRRVAGNMVKAGDWIIGERELAPKEGVTKGLIKYRPYCDYFEPTYSYLHNVYCCVGLENAAEVLDAIGMASEAERFRREAAEFGADILASMDAAALEMDGLTILPMEPDTHRLLKDGNYTAGDYYGLVASILLETEFLDEARASLIAEFMERKNGLIAGLCKFLPGGIDHAYTYGYLMTQMQRGDARKVLLGFNGMLAYGMTQDTYSGVECTNAFSGANFWTLPHLYSGSQQLRLLRNMILREDGDTLRIGDAVPRAWLENGKRISVTSAPTRFGDVGISINSQVSDGIIKVRISPPERTSPDRIVVTLRHPEFRTIRAVSLNGKTWSKFSGETIELEAAKSPLDLEVMY